VRLYFGQINDDDDDDDDYPNDFIHWHNQQRICNTVITPMHHISQRFIATRNITAGEI